jgi:hypothetical protein
MIGSILIGGNELAGGTPLEQEVLPGQQIYPQLNPTLIKFPEQLRTVQVKRAAFMWNAVTYHMGDQLSMTTFQQSQNADFVEFVSGLDN